MGACHRCGRALGEQPLAFRVRVHPRATATSPPRYAATPPESCHSLASPARETDTPALCRGPGTGPILTMDRRRTAVLSAVVAGRARHRRCCSYVLSCSPAMGAEPDIAQTTSCRPGRSRSNEKAEPAGAGGPERAHVGRVVRESRPGSQGLSARMCRNSGSRCQRRWRGVLIAYSGSAGSRRRSIRKPTPASASV
jgi:hypothetical protein